MTQYKNRCIFHSPINTSFVSKSYCAFFIPGGLSPPEFSCAFFKDKKVPPWNRKSAPRTEKKRPPEGKKAPPWKVQSTHKFPAAHQKCYMGHSVLCAYTDQKLAQQGQKNSTSVFTALTTFRISGHWANADDSWRRGEGSKPKADHCWRGGEGVQEPLILADVIYEQPLILVYFTSLKCFEDIWSYQGIIWDNVQFLPVAARFLASLRFSLWTYKSGIFWASLQIRTN